MLYAIVVVLVLIADQLVKYWVTANITLNSGSVELIPGILKLVNIHNDGAAFSLFPGYRWIFVGLAAAVTIAVILALIFHWIKSGFGRWMAVLTMAGALGNAIDRAIYGYVVDMFVIEPVKFIQVFNVADIFITVGGILFCLYLIISGGRYQVKRVASPDGKPTAKAPLEELEPAEEIPVAIAEDEEPVPTEEVEETLDDEPTEEEPEDAPVVPESEPEDEEVTEDEEEETSEEYSLASDESTEEESEEEAEEEPEEILQEEVPAQEEPEEEAAPEEEEPAPVEEVVPEEEAAPDQEAALEEESETDEETVPEEDLSREEPAPAEEEYLEEPTQMEMDLDPEPEEVVPAEEPEELPAAEPETEPVESETEEDFSFTLEDILNEFR
ncbi:MAG: signal peptidase II [Oscillospiraceae bacterium]|nr:signal peptidase II [Oscillospiraceae bacterium]